jgi:N utilization substance protein A
MADKLAALGMVSVFDVEEVGAEVLVAELEVSQELAEKVVETCSVKAKEVAIQQQKDKEEKERRAKEAALNPDNAAGEAAADAILGGGGGGAPAAAPAPDAASEQRAADILGQ